MRKNRLIFLGLWLAVTIYIGLFPTRHYTEDALNNLIFIEEHNQVELWHSQHLLAQWPGYWLYQLMGGQIRAWQAMRIAYALLAGAAVALLFAALMELTGSLPIAVTGSLILCFSYGFWHYQSDPDIYSAGYAAVTLLMLTYIRCLKQPSSTGGLWGLGLAASLAMLTHQLNVEFAGLIGLSLIWLARRPLSTEGIRVTWKQVSLYALICAVLVEGVYLVGYASASDALMRSGASQPPLIGWVLGYFNKAQAGAATWGLSLQLNTLPLAGYTFAVTWILPPRVGDFSVWSAALIGVLVLSSLVILVHLPFVLRRLSPIPRIIAIVCAVTLFLNGISGWWWQAGNVKFYLFTQIPLITLVALYVQQIMQTTGWGRRTGVAALSGAILSLVLFHLTLTLPYETQGGVFAVADAADHRAASVWFETPAQAQIFKYISSQREHILPKGFCQMPPSSNAQIWWVVSQSQAQDCTALANASLVGSFQADRSRQVWEIFSFS